MWKWHFFLLFAFGCSCKPLIFPALLFRKFSISSFDFQSQQLHSAVLQVLQPDLLCWFSYPARIVLQFSDSILLLNMLHDHNHCHCFCVGALGRKVFLPEILQKTYRRYKPWIKEVIRGSYTHVQIHTNTSLVFRDFTRLVHWCPYIRKLQASYSEVYEARKTMSGILQIRASYTKAISYTSRIRGSYGV